MATAVMAPGAPATISSSTGLLALLEEDEAEIKAHALKKLNACVADFWSEVRSGEADSKSSPSNAAARHDLPPQALSLSSPLPRSCLAT